MTTEDDEPTGNDARPSERPPVASDQSGDRVEAARRVADLTEAGEAAMARVAEELGHRAPPPASQSAHALWIGALVVILYLAGSRGLGADTPVVSLVSVAVAGGLIFSISWFEGRAARRGHVLGRKEMARELKKHLGEERFAEAREWLDRSR
jgi:hypothetical protein